MEFVAASFREDRNVWIPTVRPDDFPHVRPTWGVRVHGTFHCGGGENTRWVRNLASNPAIVVHREDATEVVILEGATDRVGESSVSDELVEALADAYEAKYGIRHGTPFFAVRPRVVLAWQDFPTDATRWEFGGR